MGDARPHPESSVRRFVGVMTGTSLDGVDVAVVDIGESITLGHTAPHIVLKHSHSHSLDPAMVEALLGLQIPSDDELHRAALIANAYADLIGRTVLESLSLAGIRPTSVTAIGVHGQTIRHQPRLGYSIQLNAPARIAEATGITVVSDFRSRDISAAGQGAPLVPAFHHAIFSPSAAAHQTPGITAVVNIGGIANITWLGDPVVGYDTGPGNMLMDLWTMRHLGKRFDDNGAWAQTGTAHKGLLAAMLGDPFFTFAPPRSTGRDLFCAAWLDAFLSQSAHANISPQDVQATLLKLTARSIALEVARLASHTPPGQIKTSARQPCNHVLVCGGGAKNSALMTLLREELQKACGHAVEVDSTQRFGWDPQVIEAAAFAWLASRTLDGLPGNLPSVTGAIGPRVLGSITPA